MKSLSLKLITSVILISTLIFIHLPNNTFNVSSTTDFTAGNFKDDNLEITRLSNALPINYFIIDDLGGGNYTWAQAVNQEWCSGSGTQNDPYLVQNLNIDGLNINNGIEIRNSDNYFKILNSTIFNSIYSSTSAGLVLSNVSNGKLINNNCSYNNGNGIVIYNCEDIIITENSINHNGINGINLINSNNISIIDNSNTINNNIGAGIRLILSNFNDIANNTINNNQYGISLRESNNNYIVDNIIIDNQQNILEINSEGNLIDNPIPSNGFQLDPITFMIIIFSIVIVVAVSTVIVLKKRGSLTEEEKKVKEELKKQKEIEKAKIGEEKQRTIFRDSHQKRMLEIDELIKDKKVKIAHEILIEIENKAKIYEFTNLLKEIEDKIIVCKKLELGTINQIKQTILNLGEKFTRLHIVDISEKSGIKDEALIEQIIEKMITNKEVKGEYFATSKALALDKIAPPMSRAGKGKGLNIFLSYSTLDSNYFQISKIVRRLELYSEINEVLYWEADSKQNIVKFMEETLKKSEIFVLFCSENSSRSKAVEDEWQAAFQLRKEDIMKIIPVYINEGHIPRLLLTLLNVKFDKENFDEFITKLYREVLRDYD